MIEVRGIAKCFVQGRGREARSVQAVAGLDGVAGDGCISGLLGPNGAGKTTQVRVDGIDVATQRQAALARIGVLSDARGLYPRLTARENIVYYGRLQGLSQASAEARAQVLAHTLQMEPLLERRTEGFSQGERMKTALARALVHDPHNIILDEPSNGLDVQSTRALREALRRLRDEQGKCIVFSTHLMQEVQRLCDRVLVMARGRAVAEGTVAELCALTGHDDFERCFVQLAFGAEAAR